MSLRQFVAPLWAVPWGGSGTGLLMVNLSIDPQQMQPILK